MHKIIRICVVHMYESCERHTYYVRADTDEGYSKEVEGHRTGSVYNNFEGLTRDEARDRALIDAATWGDFLGIKPEPYYEDGKLYEPSMTFDSYTMRREQGKKIRKELKAG